MVARVWISGPEVRETDRDAPVDDAVTEHVDRAAAIQLLADDPVRLMLRLAAGLGVDQARVSRPPISLS